MFYWMLLQGIQSESIPDSWLHDRIARSSPAKWFLFLLPANAHSSELQCSLERIQNRQEGRRSFAGDLSGFLGQCVSVLWSAFQRSWERGALAVLAPRQAPPRLVPPGTGDPLGLGQGWRACRRGVGLLARLARGSRVSLAYEPVSRKGGAAVQSRILAHDPFFPESPAFADTEHL